MAYNVLAPDIPYNEKGIPILTGNRRSAIVAELDEVLTLVSTNAGESLGFEFDQDFYTSHETCRYGRMNMVDDSVSFFTGPCEIDRLPEDNRSSYKTLISFAEEWVSGRSPDVPKWALSPQPLPQKVSYNKGGEVVTKPKSNVGAVETALFKFLYDNFGEFQVVNPSFGAMGRSQHFNTDVYLTDKKDRSWKSNVKDFIRNSNQNHPGGLRLVKSLVTNKICYLGTGDPLHIVGDRWCYLIPNPYVDNGFEKFRIEDNDEAVLMTYHKDGRLVTATWRSDCPYYVYPSSVVNAFSGSDKYVLISNFHIHFPIPDSESVVCKPWFLKDVTELPPKTLYTAPSGTSYPWRMKDGIIYDVELPVSYFSKRQLFRPPGYKWVDMCRYGTYVVSRQHISPAFTTLYSSSKVNGTRYIVIGESITVLSDMLLGDYVSGDSHEFEDGERCGFVPFFKGNFYSFKALGRQFLVEKTKCTLRARVFFPEYGDDYYPFFGRGKLSYIDGCFKWLGYLFIPHSPDLMRDIPLCYVLSHDLNLVQATMQFSLYSISAVAYPSVVNWDLIASTRPSIVDRVSDLVKTREIFDWDTPPLLLSEISGTFTDISTHTLRQAILSSRSLLFFFSGIAHVESLQLSIGKYTLGSLLTTCRSFRFTKIDLDGVSPKVISMLGKVLRDNSMHLYLSDSNCAVYNPAFHQRQ